MSSKFEGWTYRGCPIQTSPKVKDDEVLYENETFLVPESLPEVFPDAIKWIGERDPVA